MVNNHTQGIFDFLRLLGKNKLSVLTNTLENVMDNDNEYKSIEITPDLRTKIYNGLRNIGSNGKILGIVLTSKSTIYDLLQSMNNATVEEIQTVLDILSLYLNPTTPTPIPQIGGAVLEIYNLVIIEFPYLLDELVEKFVSTGEEDLQQLKNTLINNSVKTTEQLNNIEQAYNQDPINTDLIIKNGIRSVIDFVPNVFKSTNESNETGSRSKLIQSRNIQLPLNIDQYIETSLEDAVELIQNDATYYKNFDDFLNELNTVMKNIEIDDVKTKINVRMYLTIALINVFLSTDQASYEQKKTIFDSSVETIQQAVENNEPLIFLPNIEDNVRHMNTIIRYYVAYIDENSQNVSTPQLINITNFLLSFIALFGYSLPNAPQTDNYVIGKQLMALIVSNEIIKRDGAWLTLNNNFSYSYNYSYEENASILKFVSDIDDNGDVKHTYSKLANNVNGYIAPTEELEKSNVKLRYYEPKLHYNLLHNYASDTGEFIRSDFIDLQRISAPDDGPYFTNDALETYKITKSGDNILLNDKIEFTLLNENTKLYTLIDENNEGSMVFISYNGDKYVKLYLKEKISTIITILPYNMRKISKNEPAP